LATAKIREDLDGQVKRAVESGARVLTGGKKIDGPGNFYTPTVLANVSRKSSVYREEFFGPVAMLFRAKDAAEELK
jgi:succinate-semialdehyde dehydrogenase / glutarate-semialdehyde dehydrogenase